LLEKSKGNYVVFDVPLYSYNIETPYNDAKKNASKRLVEELWIRKQNAKKNNN
jgi:hypothetical protein